MSKRERERERDMGGGHTDLFTVWLICVINSPSPFCCLCEAALPCCLLGPPSHPVPVNGGDHPGKHGGERGLQGCRGRYSSPTRGSQVHPLGVLNQLEVLCDLLTVPCIRAWWDRDHKLYLHGNIKRHPSHARCLGSNYKPAKKGFYQTNCAYNVRRNYIKGHIWTLKITWMWFNSFRWLLCLVSIF